MVQFFAAVGRGLTVYVRHMAWLNAKPKPDPGSGRSKTWDAEKAISRAAALNQRKITPSMPPNSLPHIIDRLVEIGITEAAGMGAAPISWKEISAWCDRTGVDLDPWEARLLRRLSIEYLAESHRAESENCPAPWRADVTQAEIDSEQERLRMVLG